jgi:branched-chain amino acid transport system ATP-binding protein
VLTLSGVSVAYGAVQALTDVTLEVPGGQITAIVGANGAGKSTCLKVVSGLVAPTRGDVVFDGRALGRTSAERRRALGIAHVMEGRRLFGDQTVEHNLELGAYARLRRGDRKAVAADVQTMYARFPVLAEKRKALAATLSGGQQQMLVIAMALVSRPKLLLLDEPSLGLAPKLVEEVFRIVADLQGSGLTVLLVEQMASLGLAVASTGYVFDRGRVARAGTSAELLRSGDAGHLSEIYLGRDAGSHADSPPA